MKHLDKDKKVIVAMSGGVDSSVSAALLKKAGFDVTGVFMKCWNADEFKKGQCTTEEDEHWARLAAQTIDIPFYSVDLVDEYKKRVVDYFVSEYRDGRTPNPDIMCNNQIKFGVFYDKGINDFNAYYIATGHYARTREKDGEIQLLRGVDRNKDQTYFIHRLNQEKLKHVIFPIGEYKKDKVREMAREFDLPNAEKKDSQGLCFIGKVDIREFLEEYIPEKKGEVVTTDGEVVGVHKGVQYYTIGQRRGIGIGGGVPYYVVDKDVKENKLIVGPRYDEGLLTENIEVEDIHWNGSIPELPVKLTASIRYRQEPQKATISKKGDENLALNFDEPQRAATSGQSAVFYDGDVVVGGGVIV